MAYIQRKTPPVNKVYNFSLADFSGGLNNASHQLNANEASKLLNMIFCDDVLMERRFGQVYKDTLDLTNPILHMDEYKPYTGTDTLIRATATKMYVGTTEVKTIAGEMTGVNHQDKYIFADGSKLYVYGIFPQATASPYVVVDGTPVATACVLEVVSPASSYTPLDNTHVKGVTHYNYTAMTVCYEPCTNEKADTYKGTNVVPTDIKYVLSRKGRLFLSGAGKDDDNVYISDVNSPYYYPSALPMQLPPNSDKVNGLIEYDDGVVIGRQEDVYIITGETNNPGLGVTCFKLQRLNTHTGFANHKAVCVVNNYLFFLGSDGHIYALITSKYDTKSLTTIDISEQLDLFKTPINLTKSDIAEACAIYYDDNFYLSIDDVTLIYSTKAKGWTMWTKLYARSFYNLDGVLIWGNSTGRTVNLSTTSYLDFGEPYQAYWYSKRFDMGEPNTFKHFRDFFMVAHVYDSKKTDINILYEIDYSDVTTGLIVEQQISVWGTTEWGDRFVNRNIVESLPLMIGQRGRNLTFKFSNGYYVEDTVATVDGLDTVTGKKEGLLVKVTGTSQYYLYTNYAWKEMLTADLDQPMKIYQVNGDYELRGKR